MATDPASDLHRYIGETNYTRLESTRHGNVTDADTATDIATNNIMAAVYAARPAIAPQLPPQGVQWDPPQPETRRSRWGRQ